MKRFIGKVKTAAVSGALTALVATSAFQVSAEEASTSFSTDIENNQGRVTAIERAGNTVPTTVTETGAGINGNDSLTDAAGGISNVINIGAKAAEQKADQAQADLAKANKEINDLKSAIANVGPAGSDVEFKDSYGYNVKSSCNSYADKSGRCRSRIYYYKRCKKTQTIQDGQVVKTDYYSASNWSNGRYRSGSIYSGPKMIC
jgi:hypothetical protein